MNPVSTPNVGERFICNVSFQSGYRVLNASFKPIFNKIGLDITNVTAVAGDDTPVCLAGLKDVEIVTGKYLIKRKESPSS